MPKKRTPPAPEQYAVHWISDGTDYVVNAKNFNEAVEFYRQLREIHGDNVRIMKVVVKYGTQI